MRKFWGLVLLVFAFTMVFGGTTLAKEFDKQSPLLSGMELLQHDEYKKAEGKFQEFIEANPESGVAYYNLGITYIRMNKIQKAKDSLNKAKSLFEKSGNKKGLKAVKNALRVLNEE